MGDSSKHTIAKSCILVALEPHPEAGRLLRAAKRKALAENTVWEVVYTEPTKRYRHNKDAHEDFLQLLTQAEQMGATVTHIQAKNIFAAMLKIIAERKQDGVLIKHIFVGSPEDRRKGILSKSSLVSLLQRTVGETYDIVAIPLGQRLFQPKRILNIFKVNMQEMMMSMAAVLAATCAIEILDAIWPNSIITSQHLNKAILYMMACAFASVRFGLLAGIVAAVFSFLMLNMLYITPYYRLIINDVNDASNLALFLLGAGAISLFGSREHELRQISNQRADRYQSLLRMHRVTLAKKSYQDTIQTLDKELRKILGLDIVLFLPSVVQQNRLEPVFKKELVLSDADKKALSACWEESKTTGIGAPYDPGCNWRFEPMLTASGEIGVMGAFIDSTPKLDPAFGRLLRGIADQAALILERLELGQIAEETRVQAEREKLRSMLLSSVSHDLKTPLASIIGSLSVYRSMGKNLTAEQRETLINTALEEAHRLDSFITNILDMTRIESGQIALKKEWVRPDAMIKSVTKRLRDRLSQHEIIFNPPLTHLEVQMDKLMTSQVLQNLLDNAAKYTRSNTRIEISWETESEKFALKIRDHGVGIPDDYLEKVFDKYARINRQDHQVAGTGLGLAISKAIMQAQEGDILASNHPEGGAEFTILLPHWREYTHPQIQPDNKAA